MVALKRNTAMTLAVAWAILLGAHLWGRLAGLKDHWPKIFVDARAKAEIESGNPEYHAFLGTVAGAIPPGSRLLLMVYDPHREDLFEYYRSEYELFPTWVWFTPVGFVPTGKKQFVLPVDPKFLELVRAKGLSLAAVWNRVEPAKSGVYSLDATRDGRLAFAPPPAPVSSSAPADVFTVRHGWGWALGLIALVLTGWWFNAVAGLAAPFADDRPTQLALSLFTGSGLTVASMFLLALVGVRWNIVTCLLVWVLVAVWQGLLRRSIPAPAERQSRVAEPFGTANWIGVAMVIGSVLLAIADAAMPVSAWGNWDAWAIWNLKAKAFWYAGGFPKAFLQEPLFVFMHPDYPPGLPMLQAFLGYCAGGIDENLLRGLSVAYHLMLAALLARLLLELGVRRGRWLVTGVYVLIPKVLEQASSGYADLPLSGALIGALIFLVRVLNGTSPAWTVGLTCGLATLLKGEGLVLAAGGSVLLGLAALRNRATWRGVGAAILLMGLFAAPWRAVIHAWSLDATFKIDLERLENNLPDQGPTILKAALLEASGIPLTGPLLTGRDPISTAGWWTHLRDSWLPLWYVVAAGLVLGASRLLTSPFPELTFLLALQLGAAWAVYLGAQYDVIWICLTSLDRLLLQAAPLAAAIAAGAVLGSPPVAAEMPSLKRR